MKAPAAVHPLPSGEGKVNSKGRAALAHWPNAVRPYRGRAADSGPRVGMGKRTAAFYFWWFSRCQFWFDPTFGSKRGSLLIT
jgi:hypothetical protein